MFYPSCPVPEGRGLQQTARPPSRAETWFVTLLHVYGLTGYQNKKKKKKEKKKKTAPLLDLF